MNRSSLSVLFAVALVFILSSITASAQQPRAVPGNDSITNAKAIKLGKNYSVPDIGAATNEVGEPTSACASGDAISNSVWFRFSMPAFTRLYLSTAGTVLITPDDQNYYTVLAIYEMTGGVLTERACSSYQSETPFAQIEFAANAGATYYIAAGTRYDQEYLRDSTLKLNTRVLRTTTHLPNDDFETPISAADWKKKNGADDGVVCSNPTYPALNGICTFRFVGTPGVTTTLVNSMTFPTTFQPRKDALLGTVIFFRVMDTAALGKTKVKVVISYGDGTPPTIHNANLKGTASMIDYYGRVFWTVLKSSKVKSVKLEIKFASPTGTLLVDVVNIVYQADVVTRSDGLLPLPHAPAAQ